MDKFFKQVYTNADEARNEIFNSLKEKNPGLKIWQIWALYDPWDSSLCFHNFSLIPKKYGGKYIARFNSSTELEILAIFDSFINLGSFLDEITDNKNAVLENLSENWKLSKISAQGNLFEDDEKFPGCSIIYSLQE